MRWGVRMNPTLLANESAAAPPVGGEARRLRARQAIQLATMALCLALPVSCTNTTSPVAQQAGLPDASRLGVGELLRRPVQQRRDYRTPAAVLTTIALAIDSKSAAGGIAYLRAFSNPDANIGTRAFVAEYDPAVLADWQSSTAVTGPQPWDLALERGLTVELSEIRPTFRYEFSWAPDPSAPLDEIVGDTMLAHRRYRLVGSSPLDPSGTSNVILATGSCDLSLERDHGRWSIFRWVDHVDPALASIPGRRAFVHVVAAGVVHQVAHRARQPDETQPSSPHCAGAIAAALAAREQHARTTGEVVPGSTSRQSRAPRTSPPPASRAPRPVRAPGARPPLGAAAPR